VILGSIAAFLVGVLLGIPIGVAASRRRATREFQELMAAMNFHTFDVVPNPAAPSFPILKIMPNSPDRQCAYLDCKAKTDSTWDDMCIDHSLHLDGGRP
jgi:hypothetical protein